MVKTRRTRYYSKEQRVRMMGKINTSQIADYKNKISNALGHYTEEEVKQAEQDLKDFVANAVTHMNSSII